MDDLISRQAAIDALADDLSYYGSGDERAFGMSRAIGIIEKLPPVQPQRMKGMWTKAYDGYDGHVKCVQCFKTYDWDTQAQYYNFCPNCGADMRQGEQE